MKTRDVDAKAGVISREQWVRQELARKFWEPLESGAKVSVEPFSAPSTNENAINGTDLSLSPRR